MPRRSVLTPAERTSLLAFPTTNDELIRHYTFSAFDLASIRQRRGNHNRLGFAVQLCYLRYPGFALPTQGEPPAALLAFIGRQLHIEPDSWPQYAKRPETRREHLAELQAWLNLTTFSAADHRRFVEQLAGPAQQTDRGMGKVRFPEAHPTVQTLITGPLERTSDGSGSNLVSGRIGGADQNQMLLFLDTSGSAGTSCLLTKNVSTLFNPFSGHFKPRAAPCHSWLRPA